MTRENMIKVLENERECVSRDCEYDCAECDLVLPREQILETYNDLLEMLSKEEVESKRHGYWEVVDETEPRRYGCSVCKRLSWTEDNYCSYCGAKMNEVEND